MKSQDANGTNEVAQYLNAISPYSSCYQDVGKLRKEVVYKLKTDKLREWNFQQKQYEASQDYKGVLLMLVVMSVWLGLTINLKV